MPTPPPRPPGDSSGRIGTLEDVTLFRTDDRRLPLLFENSLR